MRKICNKCGLEKELEDFHKKCDSKDGYRTSCKDCCNKDAAERRKNADKEKVKEYRLEYYSNNKEKILINKKEYHLKNREKILKQKEEYRKLKPEINKIWRENNKEQLKNYNIIYKENNKEQLKEKNKIWRENNKNKMNINSINYYYNNKHIFIWRSLLYRTIKYFGTIKEGHTINMLGYSALEFKEHIEKQFLHDMNWNNHGEVWEIDHIYPLSKFDKTTDIKIVNALSNLRPLYLELNREKSNKIF